MELFELNELIAQRLGRTPNGQPRYQWCRTENLFWGSQKHGWATRQLPSGIWLAGPIYDRRSWAEPHLMGPCWTMAKWWPPDLTEQDWHARYLGQLPYPANGEYRPVGGMRHETHPSQDDTLRAIWSILHDIERTYEQHVEDGDRILARKYNAIGSRIKDEIDEMLPDYEPGIRGGARLVFTERAA